MGISKPHSASGFFFFFFLLKYPLFGLLEDGRLIVTEKVVVATYCWEFIDTPSDIDILSLHMRTLDTTTAPPVNKNGDERGVNSDRLWDCGCKPRGRLDLCVYQKKFSGLCMKTCFNFHNLPDISVHTFHQLLRMYYHSQFHRFYL